MEQMRAKIQELVWLLCMCFIVRTWIYEYWQNNLQQELQRLQKRVAELEALLEKASRQGQQTDGESSQLRAKIAELESIKTRLEHEVNNINN